MSKDVIVLGAGMIGVCTAIYLKAQGKDVLLVDRIDPGRETSYGNAGLIQKEAVEPTAFPRTLHELVRYALKRDTGLNYHLLQLPKLATRLLAYANASSPARYPQISKEYASIIAHCVSEHKTLIKSAHAEDLISPHGFHYGYGSEASFITAQAEAKRLSETYHIPYEVFDGDAFAQREPALIKHFAGAIHWTEPWAVNNPGELVKRYADLFLSIGGEFDYGDAQSLKQLNPDTWQITTRSGDFTASDVVIALGPWSDDAITRLGYHFPLFVKRGYHRHYQMDKTLNYPLMCAEEKFMLSPMQQGLRIATGIEITNRDAPRTPVQSAIAERVVNQSIIKLGDPVEDQPWMGSRPCTVDMKPIIGQAGKHKGLWFNFGHAHQGFTLGPASARLLTELMEGKATYIDAKPFSPDRF